MADAGNPPASPAKSCSICGIDVTGKPRAKDAQGRYLCQDCLAKARQTKDVQKNPPAPAPQNPGAKPQTPPPDNDNSFLLGLGAKNSVAESGTKPCPECGRALASDAVICVGCGYNFERGKRMQVKVVKAKQTDASGKAAAPGDSIIKNPHFIGVATLVAFGAFAGLSIVQTELAPIFSIVSGIYGLVIFISVVVLAFQDDTTAGVLCLLCGPYQIYWVLVKSENTLLKWLWCDNILIAIMGAFLNPAVLQALQGGA